MKIEYLSICFDLYEVAEGKLKKRIINLNIQSQAMASDSLERGKDVGSQNA